VRQTGEKEMSLLDEQKRRLDFINADLREAVATYAVYSQAASDSDLLNRLGKSRATAAFTLVRTQLLRTIVMALMRIWDNGRHNNSPIEKIVAVIGRPKVTAQIKERRLRQRSTMDFRDYTVHNSDEERQQMAAALHAIVRNDAERAAREVDAELIACQQMIELTRTGTLGETVRLLRGLRNRRLAHTEIVIPSNRPAEARPVQAGDGSQLLSATVPIVERLNLLVSDLNVRFDSLERVYNRHAACFWLNVRGESVDEDRRIKERARKRKTARERIAVLQKIAGKRRLP
jgi:hypothetical protein